MRQSDPSRPRSGACCDAGARAAAWRRCRSAISGVTWRGWPARSRSTRARRPRPSGIREAGLLAFGLADTHLHSENACDRQVAGELAKRIELSLDRRLGHRCGFAPVYLKPIEDARHLYSAFRYIVRQQQRHGIDTDPLHEASNLHDLLGLRLLGASTIVPVRRLLPRVTRAELLELFGISELQPADGPLAQVVAATLAAAALPALAGSSQQVVSARRAAIEVVAGRLPAAGLAALLGISVRRLYELRHEPPDPALVRAVKLQLHLLARVGDSRLQSTFAPPAPWLQPSAESTGWLSAGASSSP